MSFNYQNQNPNKKIINNYYDINTINQHNHQEKAKEKHFYKNSQKTHHQHQHNDGLKKKDKFNSNNKNMVVHHHHHHYHNHKNNDMNNDMNNDRNKHNLNHNNQYEHYSKNLNYKFPIQHTQPIQPIQYSNSYNINLLNDNIQDINCIIPLKKNIIGWKLTINF